MQKTFVFLFVLLLSLSAHTAYAGGCGSTMYQVVSCSQATSISSNNIHGDATGAVNPGSVCMAVYYDNQLSHYVKYIKFNSCDTSLGYNASPQIDYNTICISQTSNSTEYSYNSCVKGPVTCSAGQYLSSTGSCTTCLKGNKCLGGTWTPDGDAHGLTACSGSTEYQNETGQSTCKTVSNGYYKFGNAKQSQCPETFRDGSGASDITGCRGARTNTGLEVQTLKPTGCATGTQNSCTPGSCTYYVRPKSTSEPTVEVAVTSCSPSNCNTTWTCTSASANYYLSSGTAYGCGSSYPYSAGGNIGSGKCYKNVTRGCTQNNGSTPTNCSSVSSWNACSCAGGTYQSFADGTTSGTTSNETCTKTVAAVTAKSGYYVSGTSCTGCSSLASGFYPNSAADNTGGATKCYTNSISGKYVASAYASSATNCGGNSKYKGSHTVYYGSTSSCSSVSSGYYTTGGDENTRTGQSQCEAGYACSGGVKSNCASSNGANGRPQYSGAGATSCSECPAASSSLSSRVTSYGGWWSNNIHNSIGGCYAFFSDNDPDATYFTFCYYGWTEGTYGGSSSSCHMYNNGNYVTGCAAGKYNTITSASEWGGSYTTCYGVDCMKGKVCTTTTAGYYSGNGSTTQTQCPTNYPNSAAGASAITSCYSNTKSRAWSGSQTACTNPDSTGCSAYTCGTCSNSACDYVAYSNANGNGDGTIKSGCSTNNAACQQPVASLTAKTNYYVNGTTSCPTCTSKNSSYPYSAGGSIGYGKCYKNVTRGCTQNNCSNPDTTGCSGYTCASSCSCAGNTYQSFADGTTSGTTSNESCTKAVASLTAKSNYYVNGTSSCPTCTSKNSSYPYSAGGSIDYNSCYTNITRGCTQNECTCPANSSCTCSSCGCTGNTYVKYANGTTSGTTTNETCNKTVGSFGCDAGYYSANGTSCTTIDIGHYSPANDNNRYECTNTKPANSSYSGGASTNNCSWTCDSGYVEYNVACHARCPVNEGRIHADQYSHPLFADKTNMPSPVLHIQYTNGTMCYGYLEPGYAPAGEHGIHILYNDAVYHAVNPGD